MEDSPYTKIDGFDLLKVPASIAAPSGPALDIRSSSIGKPINPHLHAEARFNQAGRYEVDGYVYNAADEPNILMTGKFNEAMSYQVCNIEGEPLPGTELKEVWKVADAPKNDKFQYTYFAHKIRRLEKGQG